MLGILGTVKSTFQSRKRRATRTFPLHEGVDEGVNLYSRILRNGARDEVYSSGKIYNIERVGLAVRIL